MTEDAPLRNISTETELKNVKALIKAFLVKCVLATTGGKLGSTYYVNEGLLNGLRRSVGQPEE